MTDLDRALLIVARHVDIILILKLFEVALYRIERSKTKVIFNFLIRRRDALLLHILLDVLEHFEFAGCEGQWLADIF